MTGGMAFAYDPSDNLNNVINPNSVVWQRVETEYWENTLKALIEKHVEMTGSEYAKKIIYNWSENKKDFYQICPKEMLDKLENPITFKELEKKAV